MMRLRFSITSVFLFIVLCGLAVGWALDHMTLRSRIDEMLAANMRPWHRAEIRHEMPSLDFDPESRTLFGNLFTQNAAWQSGLLHYLGIDRYRGVADPRNHRTVWWQQSVKDQDGQELLIFFADHERNEHLPDCSAYIVTDVSYRLLHWEGTRIDRSLTSGFQYTGDALPLTLTYGSGTHFNADSGAYQIRVRANGIDGPRGMSHNASRGWHFPDTWP